MTGRIEDLVIKYTHMTENPLQIKFAGEDYARHAVLDETKVPCVKLYLPSNFLVDYTKIVSPRSAKSVASNVNLFWANLQPNLVNQGFSFDGFSMPDYESVDDLLEDLGIDYDAMGFKAKNGFLLDVRKAYDPNDTLPEFMQSTEFTRRKQRPTVPTSGFSD